MPSIPPENTQYTPRRATAEEALKELAGNIAIDPLRHIAATLYELQYRLTMKWCIQLKEVKPFDVLSPEDIAKGLQEWAATVMEPPKEE